jgi:hypothetical protein
MLAISMTQELPIETRNLVRRVAPDGRLILAAVIAHPPPTAENPSHRDSLLP